MYELQPGPSMQRLHQRLLAYPHHPLPAGDELLALLHDLVLRLDAKTTAPALQPLTQLVQARPPADPHQHPDILIQLIWLLADAAFHGLVLYATDVIKLLCSTDQLMARRYPALEDEDQREELIRLALNGLRLKPQDETEQQARDRLLMVSSSERARVVEASRAAEARAAAIRRALAEQRAREAADKYTRE